MALACERGGGECEGCMACYPEPKVYYCPVCGTELEYGDKVFTSEDEVLGCSECVEVKTAGEVLGE